MANVYIFRCLKCGLEYVSDGHTQPCGNCGWAKQACVQMPGKK